MASRPHRGYCGVVARVDVSGHTVMSHREAARRETKKDYMGDETTTERNQIRGNIMEIERLFEEKNFELVILTIIILNNRRVPKKLIFFRPKAVALTGWAFGRPCINR